MSRQPRLKSNSGIYHIMLRGINQQQIFMDDEDYQKYLWILYDCMKISGFQIYAYCLMSNHIHLVLKTEEEELEQIFKRIGVRFVSWYNNKYDRIGPLFQDRYKSEPVEEEAYLLTVARYVHQNPKKAGIVQKSEDYRYSSYNDYLSTQNGKMTNINYIYGIVKKDEFLKFHQVINEDLCLEDRKRKVYSDTMSWDIIQSVCSCSNSSEFLRLSREDRKTAVKEIRKHLSIRQISRLTGVSKRIIEKFLQVTKEPSPCHLSIQYNERGTKEFVT